jgi:hypothetical protein
MEDEKMLEPIAVIIIVLWLLFAVSGYTFGGYIHLLLVIAALLFLLQLLFGGRGRRVI